MALIGGAPNNYDPNSGGFGYNPGGIDNYAPPSSGGGGGPEALQLGGGPRSLSDFGRTIPYSGNGVNHELSNNFWTNPDSPYARANPNPFQNDPVARYPLPGNPGASPGNPGNPGTPGVPPPSPWLSGVTARAPGEGGATQTFGMNGMQFATPQAAQGLAGILGLRNFQMDPGIGTSYSSPMEMLSTSGNPMGGGLNAGLAQNVANMYGSAPGSYGRSLLDRDVEIANGTHNSGGRSPAEVAQMQNASRNYYANNPGTRTPFNLQGQNPGSPQGQGLGQQFPQGQGQGQGQGQQSQQNFFSQMAPIMQLLSSLGIFGGGGMGGMGGGNGIQRRPQLPQNSQGSNGFPFYSRFA